MTERPDITALLERAVSDVVPDSRRATDDVLARAGSSRLRSLRKLLAGLVGTALVGGGAVAVVTASGDREPTPPPDAVRLVVEPPAGWDVVDARTEIGCTTPLAPRTVYRQAVIADLSRCGEAGPVVTGPTLLVGRLNAGAAEQIRAAGTPVTAAGVLGFVVGYDNIVATAAWVPAGVGNLGYVALGPSGPSDPAVTPNFDAAGRWTLPQEALDAASAVRVRGDLPTAPVLPGRVSAIDLRPEWVNVDPEPGARIDSTGGIAAMLDALSPATGKAACGPTVSLRTLHLQDAATGQWSRLDVLEDADGCRTAVSELGGSARIVGHPVAVADGVRGTASAPVAADAPRVSGGGLSLAVPTGWDIVRGDAVDPCRLRKPTVVVGGVMSPSCANPGLSRPVQPFVWLTSQPLESEPFRTISGALDPPAVRETLERDGLEVTWRGAAVLLDPADSESAIDGLLGRSSEAGRVFVVGLDAEASAALRQAVGRG